MRGNGILIVLASVVIFVATAAAEEKVSILQSGDAVLRGTTGGRSVEASIKTRVRKTRYYPSETDATAPDRAVVDEVDIVVNGKRIFVPRSVVYGLVMPLEAILRVGSPLSVLTVRGGDTSGAYVVRMEFDSQRVRRKILADGSAPDKPTEITTYYFRLVEEK